MCRSLFIMNQSKVTSIVLAMCMDDETKGGAWTPPIRTAGSESYKTCRLVGLFAAE
jgi:hypothetical protein